jgi:flagellar assembly factor FliW
MVKVCESRPITEPRMDRGLYIAASGVLAEQIRQEQIASERVDAGDDTVVYVTVRAGAELSDFSANLRAPIVISGGRGHQVINETSNAPVRAALFPEVAAESAVA